MREQASSEGSSAFAICFLLGASASRPACSLSRPGPDSQQESNYATSELRSSLGADPDDDHPSFALYQVLSGSMKCCPVAMARPMSQNCLA
jgi:hypothetical protein